MVRPVTLATTAAPASALAPAPPLPPAAAAQLDAFWRALRHETALYLVRAHHLAEPQAMERAGAVVAAVRETTDLPDRETALARCLDEAAALVAAGRSSRPGRPAPLPAAGLPMEPQPLAPVLIAPSPLVGTARLWAMAVTAMLVPALAAVAAVTLT